MARSLELKLLQDRKIKIAYQYLFVSIMGSYQRVLQKFSYVVTKTARNKISISQKYQPLEQHAHYFIHRNTGKISSPYEQKQVICRFGINEFHFILIECMLKHFECIKYMA